jgi:hypothetical protein
MSILIPKKLTGWLILLIIVIGPLQFGGAARSLSTVPDSFRPYLAEYPSLDTAIMIFQLLIGGSIAVWAYTAWVLYRREPGTLKTAQTSFLLGAALRIAGSYSIPLLGGLPPETSRSLIQQALPFTVISLAMVSVWYLYLTRSQRVREIYAA